MRISNTRKSSRLAREQALKDAIEFSRKSSRGVPPVCDNAAAAAVATPLLLHDCVDLRCYEDDSFLKRPRSSEALRAYGDQVCIPAEIAAHAFNLVRLAREIAETKMYLIEMQERMYL
jgi:hypothetical protein